MVEDASGTCVIAARSRTGVIISSDSRGMGGTAQIDGLKKIHLLCNEKIAVTSVGPSGVFDDVRRKLEKQTAFREASNIYDIVDVMKTAIFETCRTHLQNEAFKREDFYFEVVVCGLENLVSGDPVLYMIIDTGYSEPIPQDCDTPYYVTGHGRHYASTLMNLFYRNDIDNEQMIELASYVLRQTGLVDTSVGGKPQIVVVEPERLPRLLQPDAIEKIVNRVDALSSTLNQILGGLFQEKELYKVVDNYLLADLGGIVKDNRKFEITLKPYKKSGCDLILGEELSEYDARNDSETVMELFVAEGQIDTVSTGEVTIPEPLKELEIPEDPKEFWDLLEAEPPAGLSTGLKIDNRDVKPVKTVNFKDPENRAKGVSYRIEAHETIGPHETRKVKQASKKLFDVHDYILKKLSSYGNNVEVIVHKPKNLEVHLVWFVTARGKRSGGVTLHPPIDKEDYYSRKLEGIVIPGNGFAVMWWLRHHQDRKGLAE
jgi:20S proteasome alpha/beta subunit